MSSESGEKAVSKPGQLTSAYSSSWFDRFSGWVAKLPFPSWFVYLSMSIALVVLGMLIQRVEGSGTIRDWNPINFVAIFQIAYMLSYMHYLDRHALGALDQFSPALNVDDSDVPELARLISTLPSGRTMLACIISTGFAVVLTLAGMVSDGGIDSSVTFSMTPFGFYSMSLFFLLWFVNGLFVYHTIHQLRAVNYIYTKLTQVHPFHQRELYAFSGLSARTGVGIVLMTPFWIVFDPGSVSLSISIAFAVLGLVVFVTPLVGVHRLLGKEKDRLMDENAKQVEEAISHLTGRLQSGGYDGLDGVDQALTSLEKARAQIERISTWPWRTETLRQVVVAVLLPLLIWIIQYFLAQYLAQ